MKITNVKTVTLVGILEDLEKDGRITQEKQQADMLRIVSSGTICH
jgi:hypothetical protein